MKSQEKFFCTVKKDMIDFVTQDLPSASQKSDVILITDCGKHTWFLDFEQDVVMLFEPAEG